MARPQKTGLEYFPLDVDILSDIKVMKLIRRYGNGTAFSIFVALLCRIYKEGYYIKYEEDDTVFHLSVVLNEGDEQLIEKVIQACLEIGLFDKDIFEHHHVLTSAAIQKRYLAIQQTSRRVAQITLYKCDSVGISVEETADNEEENKNKTKKHSKKTQNSEETTENNTETPINKNKLKENKGKKNKENINSSTTPPPPSARACVREEGFEENSANFEEDNLEKEAELLKNSKEWREETKKYFKLSDDNLEDLLKRFISHCRMISRKKHKNREDLQSHFASWAEKEIEKRPQTSKSLNYGTRQSAPRYSDDNAYAHLDLRRPAPCPVGTTQADYE